MAVASDNRVSGSNYLLYMRAQGAAKSENKLLMCQTDFSLNQTNNETESVTKCGRDTVAGLPTREATIGGELAMPVDSGTQDYVDIKELQEAFDSGAAYSFTLMPKDGTAALSNGKLQIIDFDAKFTTYNQTYPTEGNATFENTLSVTDAPVYTDYIATT